MPEQSAHKEMILGSQAIDPHASVIDLRGIFNQFRQEVIERYFQPGQSRNFSGLELVKKLHLEPNRLTDVERSKLLFVSCDNNTDGIGTALNIEAISLSSRTLQGVDLGAEIIKEPLPNRQPIFQFTPELLNTLRLKEAVIFVTDYEKMIGAVGTFVGFLDNEFCRFLMNNRHVFFAIGTWNEGSKFTYRDMETIGCSGDVIAGGQDVASE